MIRWLHAEKPGWIRGVMVWRLYILFVSDDYKRFVTVGMNKP